MIYRTLQPVTILLSTPLSNAMILGIRGTRTRVSIIPLWESNSFVPSSVSYKVIWLVGSQRTGSLGPRWLGCASAFVESCVTSRGKQRDDDDDDGAGRARGTRRPRGVSVLRP